MNEKDIYMKKLEAELEQAQAKLAEWRAKAKSMAADGMIMAADTSDKTVEMYNKAMTEAETTYESLKVKMQEMKNSSGDAWQILKDGTDSAWHQLSASIREAANKLKA